MSDIQRGKVYKGSRSTKLRFVIHIENGWVRFGPPQKTPKIWKVHETDQCSLSAFAKWAKAKVA